MTGPGTTETDFKIIDRVVETAEKKGWTMAQVSLAWMMPTIASPIVGISSIPRLDEAVGVRDKKLTEEEVKYLEELYEDRRVEGHS